MTHVGIDWAEAHHDVCILDEDGTVLARFRIANTLQGVAVLHEQWSAGSRVEGGRL